MRTLAWAILGWQCAESRKAGFHAGDLAGAVPEALDLRAEVCVCNVGMSGPPLYWECSHKQCFGRVHWLNGNELEGPCSKRDCTVQLA